MLKAIKSFFCEIRPHETARAPWSFLVGLMLMGAFVAGPFGWLFCIIPHNFDDQAVCLADMIIAIMVLFGSCIFLAGLFAAGKKLILRVPSWGNFWNWA